MSRVLDSEIPTHFHIVVLKFIEKLFSLGDPLSSITFAGVTLTSKLRFLNLHHLEGSTLTIEELDITEDVDNTENELFESAHFNIEEQIYM